MSAATATGSDWLKRYDDSAIRVFGAPGLVLDHGSGCTVWDVDGRSYLDLLSGIAVNSLGHAHPDLVAALSRQVGELVHVSNFFTTPAQVRAAERVLEVAEAPPGSGVFFCNSGSEAVEAAIKLSRRTGRSRIVALEGAFHGRTTGAVALTHKAAYRDPFEPLIPDVHHVPPGDVAALDAAVDDRTAMLILEPVQGEAGVRPLSSEYVRAARAITAERGALLVIDEIQTGIARTGTWFAHQRHGIVPDAMTLAKGLGGGVPIGALVTFGPEATALLGAGQHGSTFGGNPLACVAALTVLDTIERDGLVARAADAGDHLQRSIMALEHPQVREVRGHGLLRAVVLAALCAADAARAARDAGFLVNPVAADALRLAPPLIVTTDELDRFVAALPAILDTATTVRSTP